MGAVFSTERGRSCYFNRTMRRLRANEKGTKAVGTSGLDEFLEWIRVVRERPLKVADAQSSSRRPGEGRSAKEQNEEVLRLAQSIAMRSKALFPDHVVLVTDKLAPDSWASALDVHEGLNLVPFNIISLDAPKSSLRLLADLAKRTKGTLKSASSSEFTK